MTALHVRSGIFYIKRRVPRAYAAIDGRAYVWISLQTGNRREAQEKEYAVWSTVVASWRARAAGDHVRADTLYAEALLAAAGARRMPFLTLHAPQQPQAALPAPVEPSHGPAEPFLISPQPYSPQSSPIQPLSGPLPSSAQSVPPSPSPAPSSVAPAAATQKASITVSEALTFYFKYKELELKDKSPDQLRRWRNPRLKAVRNFIDVAGDKPVADITADDMLDFRGWWIDKINEQGLDESSANKDFIHLGSILLLTAEKKRLGIVPPVRGYALKARENKIGKSFSDDWIRTRILAPGALDGLNVQARGILIGMINTGYRPSEGAALLPEHIHVDCDHPHIEIKPVGREVKSLNAIRYIPLTGVSLKFFQEHREGFPRYRNSASLSATVNKYMRENGLLESDEHSMYSLRHSFQDRMVRAKLDPRLQADFMGHAFDRSRYGDGGGLAFKYDEMSKIAI